MLGKPLFLSSISLLATLNFNAFAAMPVHMVVAPTCLTQHLNTAYQTFATENNLVLLQTNQIGIEQLMAAKNSATTFCGGFMDVTNSWNKFTAKTSAENKANIFLNHYAQKPTKKNAPTAYKINYPNQVNQLLKKLNPQRMWNDLTTLTSFENRYANSDEGVQAAAWFKEQIEKIAKNRKDVSVYYVKTGSWYEQPSVVAKFGTSSEPGIVIGGHMDTYDGFKPGADDDGSGSAVVLEVAKTLLQSNMHFKKPIYFIWYAAEEEGEVGSQYVVDDFMNKNIPVSEVIQFDMTGFAYKNDPTMWLMTDYVDYDLTAYLKTLITTYVKRAVEETACGYACSDHASWNSEGFAASMPAEAAFEHTNPVLHTSRDTMEKLTLAHMTDYAKLGVAFAVELAEPTK